MTATTFKITNGEFGLSLTDPGLPVEQATIADYQDFTCRITSGAIIATPNIDTEEVPATWCEPASETNVPTATSFACDLSVLQDPQLDTIAGLAKFLYENDAGVTGVPAYFYMGLQVGGPPKAIGSCYLVPMDFGGEARVVLTADLELPIEGRPDIMFGGGAELPPGAIALGRWTVSPATPVADGDLVFVMPALDLAPIDADAVDRTAQLDAITPGTSIVLQAAGGATNVLEVGANNTGGSFTIAAEMPVGALQDGESVTVSTIAPAAQAAAPAPKRSRKK